MNYKCKYSLLRTSSSTKESISTHSRNNKILYDINKTISNIQSRILDTEYR